MAERTEKQSQDSSVSRRDFLKAGLAGAAVVGLGTVGRPRETRASAQVQKSELKAWAKKNMIGVENATFPSFTPDMADLDEDGIRWDVQQAIKHGFFSTLVACETGLSFDEAKRFVSIVCDEAKGKIFVSTTLLFDTFEQNMAMLQHAEKAGCDTVLLGFHPSYYPNDPEEIYQTAKKMADSTNLGLVLYPSPHYNFQRFHPSGFPMDVLERMADFENAVAIKVGEPGLAADCTYRFGDKILINNPVERQLPLMVQACQQQWIGAGCYECFQSPEKPYLVQYFTYLREGKTDKAFEIYWKLTPVRVMFERKHSVVAMLGTYDWPMMKYYQWLVGGNGGYTRQPCMKVHQYEMDPYKFALMQVGITPRQNDEEFYYGRMNYEKMKKK